MKPLTALTSRMRFMRSSRRITACPLAFGVAAPHSPVLPPWGMTGTWASVQSLTTSATSAALPGRTIARAWPW